MRKNLLTVRLNAGNFNSFQNRLNETHKTESELLNEILSDYWQKLEKSTAVEINSNAPIHVAPQPQQTQDVPDRIKVATNYYQRDNRSPTAKYLLQKGLDRLHLETVAERERIKTDERNKRIADEVRIKAEVWAEKRRELKENTEREFGKTRLATDRNTSFYS